MRSFLIGVDEVGRGALAGHVYAAAVILRDKDLCVVPNYFFDELKDSKKLSPNKRMSIYTASLECELIFGVGVATVKEIDQFNILNATMIAMSRAINQCLLIVKLCLLRLKTNSDNKVFYNIAVDGISNPKNFGSPCSSNYNYRTIKSGDTCIPEISCASIIAKVLRDKEMTELHNQFPVYDFIRNKGYGTKKHMLALKENGASGVHRLSFKPIRRV